MNKDYPYNLGQTYTDPILQNYMWLTEKYRDYELRMVPAELKIATGKHLLFRKKGDTSPAVIVLGNVMNFFPGNAVRNASQRLKDGIDRYDYVTLSSDQWEELKELEDGQFDIVPTPFSYEALKDFCLTVDGGSTPLVFQRSQLDVIKWQGHTLHPLVDCAIGIDKKKRLQLGGIGLFELERGALYQVAYYWMLDIPDRLIPEVVQTISSYFIAQNAFHVCPERIIEVKTDSPDPQTNETLSDKKTKATSAHPNKATMRRTIYLRDAASQPTGRKFDYQCECWYVRGFWRQLKSGQRVWIEGYYKGRKRNDETARHHTKNYVL